MSIEFKKAVKTKSRLRLAIDGISGSGKTYTALAIASGMGGPVALIDSEHGSASLYADRFEFDTVDLMEFQIENYIDALNAAAKSGYPVVIIDSTSHAWDALVERVDQIANNMKGGNTSFRAWAQGTPLQKQFIEAMLNYPGHIIVTCRSKTEYSIDKNADGKTEINKVGLAAVQRQGFEYEMTMAMTMDASHTGHVTKDRTGKFQDKYIKKPGKEFGEQLIAWLNEGAAPLPQTQTPPAVLPSEGVPPPADTQKPESKKIVDAIVAILTEKTPDLTDFFTDKERKDIKEEIFETKGDIEKLKTIAAACEGALKIRREEYIAIPFDEPTEPAPAPAQPTKPAAKNDKQTLNSELSAILRERREQQAGATQQTTTALPDDGFIDDIPGQEEQVPAMHEEQEAELVGTGASDGLDIF
jgi:hypothetical protein